MLKKNKTLTCGIFNWEHCGNQILTIKLAVYDISNSF